MLQATDVADYQRDGYLPGRPILTAEQSAAYFADCARCCGPKDTDGVRRQAYNRLKPYLLFPWAAELVRHPDILDIVEAIIGPDILLFHTTVWFKEPESAGYVPWHQDATYFGLDPLQQVTAWIALTPSTRDNGCVQVLPGTHRDGQRPHRDQADQRAMLSRGQTLTDTLDESQAVDLLLAPGDVTFHHTLLMHRSAPNLSNKPRIGFGISYIPTHVRHVTETRLTASVVRGVDRFGHFDTESEPQAEDMDTAISTHTDAVQRFFRASESIAEPV